MEIRGMTIGGLAAVRVRDALRAFNEVDTPRTFENGKIRIGSKALTAEFLAKQLNLDAAEGKQLLIDLIRDGYIDKNKLIPTVQGMVLVRAEDRDRLPRNEASKILNEFLDAVENVNSRLKARVSVQRVYVFGSYLTDAETVGDIDLLIEAPLPDDCVPEDLDERDIVLAHIETSEYLSFHYEFDAVAAGAEKLLIYPR